MVNSTQSFAIGWVHNLNAFWQNHYYYLESDENYNGCHAPSVDSIFLTGFNNGDYYVINFFQSCHYSNILPSDYSVFAGGGGISLDLSSAQLGCKIDSLPEDYAFTISLVPQRSGKPNSSTSILHSEIENSGLDFSIYPNPNSGLINLWIYGSEGVAKKISVYDPSGREIYSLLTYSSSNFKMQTLELAKGVYYIKVSIENSSKIKRFIVQ